MCRQQRLSRSRSRAAGWFIRCTVCGATVPRAVATEATRPLLKTPPRDLAAAVGTRTDEVLAPIDYRRGCGHADDGVRPAPLDPRVGFAPGIRTIAVARPAPVSAAAELSEPMPTRLADMLGHAGFVPDARGRPALGSRFAMSMATRLRLRACADRLFWLSSGERRAVHASTNCPSSSSLPISIGRPG